MINKKKFLGLRREWKPEEAESWTKEDWVAIIVSPIAYALLMIGLALLIFLKLEGLVLFLLGIGATVFLHYLIDPKLKAVSSEYEKKQKEYLERLEMVVRWKENE
ncbi:MAG: hypothetical protein N3B16_10070 [Candidatus Aminicenantes bacterium]|nr:hypothetical protein [Candidatus Aminicenantes bacterium]